MHRKRFGGRAAFTTNTNVFFCVTFLLSACSGGSARPRAIDCGDTTCDAGCLPPGDVEACNQTGGDLPPVPNLRFNLQAPQNADDYPFTPVLLPRDSPPPHSTVFLSAADSIDPEGKAIGFFWNVQDPTGKYLTLDPDAAVARPSFSPSLVGPHVVTLEVVEAGGLRQIAQVMLTLEVSPRPCAPDGFSSPCSDEISVPGGRFLVGSTDDTGFTNEHPRHAAIVAPYFMDKYEVTVGRFRRFLSSYAGGNLVVGTGAHPLIAGSGWQAAWNGKIPETSSDFMFAISECGGAWTDQSGVSEARPIGCVTWYEALAFCIWDGKRFPTEAEWEYASAGGDEQRIYPWGNDPPSRDLAVFGCLFDGQPRCTDADLPVVGSVPGGAGRWGHLDLAGSLWEWTFDVYAPYDSVPCDNCANLSVGDVSGRVFRGGDFLFDDPSSLRAASRYGFDGAFPDQRRGFRCARTPVTVGQ